MTQIRSFVKGEEKACRKVILSGIKITEKLYGKQMASAQKNANTPEKILEKAKKGELKVAKTNGQIIGTGFLAPNGEISNIYLLPKYRGKNTGTRIIKALEKHAKNNGIKTVKVYSNTKAENFYLKQGYAPTGKTKTYKSKNASAKCTELKKKL